MKRVLFHTLSSSILSLSVQVVLKRRSVAETRIRNDAQHLPNV
jgi:hypothetical protein